MNLFLIDADNLNAGAWVDEAFRVLEATEGPLPVRRAYGSADNLKGLTEVLCHWAVRPFVNLSLSKNTTDVALAVDAMALACQTPPPATVVIGSGDADFLPLVVRLRERGIRMVCVSERGKMAREAVCAYDRVILVGAEQAFFEAHQAHPAALPALGVAPPVLGNQKVATKPADQALNRAEAAQKVATKKAAVQDKSPKSLKKSSLPPKEGENQAAPQASEAATHVLPTEQAPARPTPPEVQAILQALPALQTGQAQALAWVAKALLDARLRGKNTTATKLLKKFPLYFSLRPPEKPTTVTYLPQQDAP